MISTDRVHLCHEYFLGRCKEPREYTLGQQNFRLATSISKCDRIVVLLATGKQHEYVAAHLTSPPTMSYQRDMVIERTAHRCPLSRHASHTSANRLRCDGRLSTTDLRMYCRIREMMRQIDNVSTVPGPTSFMALAWLNQPWKLSHQYFRTGV